jgi:hypothetical protein
MKSLVDAQSYNVGALKVPKLDADAAEWRGIYRKLGMPETSAGYSVPDGALPEGVTLDAGLRDWFFKTAHDAGLSTQQVHTMLRAHLDRTQGQQQGAVAAQAEQLKQVEAGVRGKYGAATDRLMTLAQRAVAYFADEPTHAQLQDGGLSAFLGMFGGAPWLIHAFVQMGESMAEDHLILGEVAGSASPDAAAAEAAAIMGNAQHAYWNEQNPAHHEAVQRMSALHQIMAAGR